MFKSVLKDIKNTRKSIEKSRIEQQHRLREFDQRHLETLKSMSENRKDFENRRNKISKELSRHF